MSTHFRLLRTLFSVAIAFSVLFITACGGGGGSAVQLDFSAAKTNLKGSVQGLTAGNSIVLTNGPDTVTLNADGAFMFATQLSVGNTYSAVIATLPANQSCVATYTQGTVSAEVPPLVKVICAGVSATTETFVATGSLTTARLGHTATKLSNGKVLVTGGYDSLSKGLASAELYDPTTGMWSATGSLLSARVEHAATLLPNGKVLVSGGFNAATGQNYLGTELYDPNLGTWAATGNLNLGRTRNSTTLVNGKVLLAGGDDQNTGNNTVSTEQYDPATGVWTLKANLAIARVAHTAVALANGKVLVSGGSDNNNTILTSAELYDPTTGLWSATFTSSEAKTSGLATVLADGKVLVYGGENPNGFITNSEVFNPNSSTVPWVYTAADSTGQSHIARTATLLPNGKVLFTGGYDSPGTGILSPSNQLYDPATGVWSATAKLIRPRASHTATLLNNGKVLVVGGSVTQTSASGATGAAMSATAELYVVSAVAGAWQATGSLTTARTLHTATLLDNGNVLVVGGDTSLTNNGTGVIGTTELYSPLTGMWTAGASLVNPRYGHTATLLQNGKILVAGGASASSTRLSSAELFDPATGLWSATGSMLGGHNRHTATLLPNGKVLVVGASTNNSNGISSSQAELYDPATGAWTVTGQVAQFRDFHSAVLLANGRVLVTGGQITGFGTATNTAEVYDPTTNTWTTTAPMTSSRRFAATVTLPNGKVLVTGATFSGSQATAELFDPATNTFTATGAIPVATGCFPVSMTGAIPALLPTGKVLLSSGFSCAKITEYDTSTSLWTSRTVFTGLRLNGTSTLLKNGKLLSVGGSKDVDDSPLATAELF